MLSRTVTVLAVDDDVRILRLVQRLLELEGYRCLTATSGEAALDLLDEESPSLLLLDVMLPGMDGYAICRRIREFSRVPIIVVTARGNEEEKIEGFDAGADDYITKPFSTGEMVARVKAVLRRFRSWEEKTVPTFCCQDLTIDFARHVVTLGGKELTLTATEYRLLTHLAGNAGMVLTPDQILEKVWGEEYTGDTHLLQVNIGRLRQKLGDDTHNPRYILTKPGIGYTMGKSA